MKAWNFSLYFWRNGNDCLIISPPKENPIKLIFDKFENTFPFPSSSADER